MTERWSGFFFLTPVWGESYTALYINTVIPAQLAPGNLLVFKGQPNCRYIIYTRPQDAETIRASAVYEKLAACMPVTFEWIREDIGVIHDLMTDCFRRGLAEAEAADAAILLMTPDIVFSDGSFATLKRLSAQGRDVVFIPAIRTIKNAVATSLARLKSDDVIAIPPRDLVRVAFDNLHPLAHSSWWEEGGGGLMPANIYWRVGKEGILAHCFHLHPIMVRAEHKGARFFGTVDDDYIEAACPDSSRDQVVADSDDLFAIELSDPSRYFEMRFAKGSIDDTVRWAEQFTNQRHQKLFVQPIRMHAVVEQSEIWAAAEARARPVVDAVMAQLDRPVTQLLFQADLISRRFVRWTKAFRLRLANPYLAGSEERQPSAIESTTLNVLLSFTRIRGVLVDMMRWLAAWIEWLAAWPYYVALRRQLAALKLSLPDAVVVANSPGKMHIAPALASVARSFARDRQVTVARDGTTVILEAGQPVAADTRRLAILEIDAFRADGVEGCLHAERELLRDGGRMIVYLHRLGPQNLQAARPPLSKADLLGVLSAGFAVEGSSEQGGLGTAWRVRLESWVRGVINRRLDLRGLLIVFCIPLLPVIVVLGALVIVLTAILDGLDSSDRFAVSSLIVARKRA